MFVKLFLLGRPGSGKSRTARYIADFVEAYGWVTKRFKDYDILEKMFQEDLLRVQFRASERGGFDVLDVTTLDKALRVLEKNIRDYIRTIEKDEFIIIEFARKDYDQALSVLSQDFLQDAHFLLIDTEPEICKQRIHERIIHPLTSDDHFVSDFILNTYYREQYLSKDNMIKERFFKEVENQGFWGDFTEEINLIIMNIVKTP